jgi:hypothetical protein
MHALGSYSRLVMNDVSLYDFSCVIYTLMMLKGFPAMHGFLSAFHLKASVSPMTRVGPFRTGRSCHFLI